MLKEAIKSLSGEERKMIQVAFDSRQECIVKLENNRFVGVNVAIGPNIKILEQHKYWLYGEYV